MWEYKVNENLLALFHFLTVLESSCYGYQEKSMEKNSAELQIILRKLNLAGMKPEVPCDTD
jgi:hypothetical protein